MKRLLLPVLALLASVASAQLIQNPGFETGGLDGWMAGGSASVTKDAPHSGTYAALNSGSWTSIFQRISNLGPNTQYRLTAWGRLKTASAGNNQAIYVNATGSDLRAWITSTQYQQFTIDFTTDESGAATVGSEEVNGQPVGAYVDDFNLTMLTQVPPGPPARLLAESQDGAVKLSWTGSPITASYLVRMSKTSGGPYTVAGTVRSSPLTISGLTNNVKYYFRVAGRNSYGVGKDSTEVSATPAPAPPPSAQVRIGAGLEGLADWSFSSAFVDLVKQSRGFMSPDQPWANPVPVDANGWPTQDFGIVLATWTGMTHTGGTYRISFQCNATPVIAPVASPGTIQNVVRNASTGLVTADLVYPEGGDQLMLSFRQTSGGVRNLQILRPGTSASDEFTAPLLAQLARFENLRFMDWASTNGNPVVHWTDRTLPSSPSYATGPGIPWEMCMDLCNRVGHDAWINIPAQADDNYVHNLARLVRDRLDPKLHVYLEYSNEVWNWSFSQATWNANAAKAEVAAGGTTLNYDGSTDSNIWAARRIAKRIEEIADVFRTEYGDTAYAARVRPVLATQISWPSFWLTEGLKFLNAVYGPPSQYLYAAAGAPYFNMGDADQQTNLSVTQVLAALNANVDAMASDPNMELCATLARFYNLKFVAYEGGSDTFGPNNIAAKKAASLDPRLMPIVLKYLETWSAYGFDLFNWFVAGATSYDSQFGTWGLTNDMSNQSTPKIRAIDIAKMIGSVPLTQGRFVPGIVDPRQYGGRGADWLAQDVLQLSTWDWQGPSRDYLLRVAQDGTYQISLSAATAVSGVTVEIWMNNSLVGTLPIPNSGNDRNFANTAKLSVTLGKGMNALRMKLATGDSFRTNGILVQK